MVWRSAALSLVVLIGACSKTSQQQPAQKGPEPAAVVAEPSSLKVQASAAASPAPAEQLTAASLGKGPKVVPLAVCKADGQKPLDAARKFYDANKFDEALSCAAQA